MKKLLSILLVLSLVYGLCGCAGGETAGQTEPNKSTVLSGETVSDTVDTAEEENKDISCDFTVSVTMPAAFTVYLDNAMHIAAMEAGDADAEAILSQVEVAGLPYDEGMGLVLNAAYAQGFLIEHGEVYFTVDSETFTAQLMMDLFAPVIVFEKENAVFVSLTWDVIAPEEPDFSPNMIYGTQKIEENGQTIHIDWCPIPVSPPITLYNFYSAPPIGYSGAPGETGNDLDTIRIKMLGFGENGEWNVRYFSDSRVCKEVYYNGPEGIYDIFWSKEYENGTEVGSVNKQTNGFDVFCVYENGVKLSEMVIYLGDFIGHSISSYHSNGNIAAFEEIVWDNGFHASSDTYDENGNPISSSDVSRFTDGSYVEWQYENGQTVYNKSIDCYGIVSEVEYKNNQPVYQKIINPDGTYIETEFENGQPVYEKTINPDGTYQEGHYENGNWTWTEGTIEPTEPES